MLEGGVNEELIFSMAKELNLDRRKTIGLLKEYPWPANYRLFASV